MNITYKTKLKTCSSYTEEEDEEEEEEEEEEKEEEKEEEEEKEVEALPEAERPGLAFPSLSLWSLVNQLSIGIPNIMGKSFVKGNGRGPLKNIILIFVHYLTYFQKKTLFCYLTFNLIIVTLFYVEIIESEYPHGIKHHVIRKGGHS